MTSIESLQAEYFHIINNYFEKEIEQIASVPFHKVNEVVEKMKSSSLTIQAYPMKTVLDKKFEDFLWELNLYWVKNESEIVGFTNTCGENSVTIWPDEPIIELTPKFLLYYDMVLIPDPIMNLGQNVINSGNYRDALIYFSILNQIKDLQSAKTNNPLFIIVPYKKAFMGNENLSQTTNLAHEFIRSPSGKIALEAFNSMTNLSLTFTDSQDLFEKLNRLTVSQLNSNLNLTLIHKFLHFLINDPNYLQAASSSGRLDFIISKRLQKKIMNPTDFYALFGVISSFYAIFEVREYNTLKLCSTNLVTNTHLPFAEFKYAKLSEAFGSVLEIPEEHLINYSIKQEFNWLNHIDINTILELRGEGKLENYRNTLRIESDKIKNISFNEFPKLSLEFETNVLSELNKEQKEIEKEIKRIKWKRGITTANFVATTGLTFSSMAFPALLPLTVASSALGLLAGASIKDLVSDVILGKGQLKELNKRPVSILLGKRKSNKRNK